MAHQAYPALMHMILLGTVSSGDKWMNVTVGEPIVLPASVKLKTEPMLRDAAQVILPLQPATDAMGQSIYKSNPMQKPGIYTLATGAETYKIAVNVPADEADIRTTDDAHVKSALGDIDVKMEGDSVPSIPVVAVQKGKDMGWIVLLAVLGLAASECFMAMKFGHYRRK